MSSSSSSSSSSSTSSSSSSSSSVCSSSSCVHERDREIFFASSNGKFTAATITLHHAITQEEKQKLISDRRHLHAHPELSFQEFETAKFIENKLKNEIKCDEVYTNIGRTGVVGIIRGTGVSQGVGPSLCLALRADMDGLPIQETSTSLNTSYRSTVPNVMHACGHDGHMSSLLCTGRILSQHKHLFAGSVKLIFQPAEEGYGGAPEMIKDGVLEEGKQGPRVDEIYGIHLWNYHPLGYIGVKEGPLMASSDKFEISVHGVGGHGAVPDVAVDAIVAAAQLITHIQTIVSRNVSPLEPAVVSVGTIKGGYANNIIADYVELSGTVRTMNLDVRSTIIRRLNELCSGMSASFPGVVCELSYHDGYPCTVNDDASCVNHVREAAKLVVDEKHVTDQGVMTMGAEDFSYFLLQRPGCFWFVGSRPTFDTIDRPHHKSIFDFDETSLEVSVSTFLRVVERRLQFQIPQTKQ